MLVLLFLFVLSVLSVSTSLCDALTLPRQRFSAEEEGKSLVDYGSLLEGITEPFAASAHARTTPLWAQTKASADAKAAQLLFPQAVQEYVSLLRQPSLLLAMPLDVRHEVFLSLAQLLRTMGFAHRAELLLYEAISYAEDAFAAHAALARLSLAKEDSVRAAQHLKHCLVSRERDAETLVTLAALLWAAEGRVHEARFFLSRAVEEMTKARNSKHENNNDTNNNNSKKNKNKNSVEGTEESTQASLSQESTPGNSQEREEEGETEEVFAEWLESLLVRVLHGEFRLSLSSPHSRTITHSGTDTQTHGEDSLSHFLALQHAITEDSLSPQSLFSLGERLCEKGRPRSGRALMQRALTRAHSHSQTHPLAHNLTVENMQLRLSLHIPAVSLSLTHTLQSYVNLKQQLALTAESFSPLDLSTHTDWRALSLCSISREHSVWRNRYCCGSHCKRTHTQTQTQTQAQTQTKTHTHTHTHARSWCSPMFVDLFRTLDLASCRKLCRNSLRLM